MKDILRMVAKDNDIVMEKLEVILDHVHVLISFPPSKAPTSAIKALKGRSAFIFLKRHGVVHSSFSNDIQKFDNHNIGVVIYGLTATI